MIRYLFTPLPRLGQISVARNPNNLTRILSVNNTESTIYNPYRNNGMPQGAGVRGPVMRQLLNGEPSIYRPINRFGSHTPPLPTMEVSPSAPTSSLVNTLNSFGISARTVSTPTEPLQPINIANLATPPGDSQTTDIATPPGDTQTTNIATAPGNTQDRKSVV